MTGINAVSSINHEYKPNIVLKALSRVGNAIPQPVSDFLDLTSKGSMKRITLIGFAATFLLGVRYWNARNEDEKREVLTRDSGSIVTAVYAVPLLKKLAGALITKITGVPISHGEGGFVKNLNPEKGVHVASYGTLAEWLSVKNIESFNGIKGGFAGYLRNIKKLGGDVIKGLSTIDENASKTLKEIADALGYKKEITNKNIIGLIITAQNSKDVNIQQKLDTLKKLFVGDNPFLQKASHLKSVTEFGAIAATAFLLGGFLPWLNIKNTREKYKNGSQESANTIQQPVYKIITNNSSMAERFKQFQAGTLN